MHRGRRAGAVAWRRMDHAIDFRPQLHLIIITVLHPLLVVVCAGSSGILLAEFVVCMDFLLLKPV